MDDKLSNQDFGQLKTFVAVAQTRSFARGAEALGLTASAVSQSVRVLEERLGVRLLNRTTRSVALTDAGVTLLARVRPAVDELGDAMAQIRQLRNLPAGVLRIHSFRVAANLLVSPMLARFSKAYPDITLDLTLDDHVVDLVEGGFDAAIRIGEVIERDLVAVKLGPELQQLAVASPAYLARHGVPERPQDLAKHRCIGWRWPGFEQPYKWEFAEKGQPVDVAVSGPLIANSREFCVAAAVEGLGIAFAIKEVVAADIAQGRLVPLLADWSPSFPGFHICFASQRQMTPMLRAFIDALRSSSD